jgi:ubiquinone/menaquinone biosynthesis C-methylase UbiE
LMTIRAIIRSVFYHTDTNKLHPPGKPNPFGLPRGLLGVLAGWIMGRTGIEHNLWAASKLDVRSSDDVLEIGFGPGVSIQWLAERATKGFVAGIDPSPVMLQQARSRNAAALKSGRIVLQAGTVSELPFGDQGFDKVLSVNNVMMWPGPEQSLREVYRVMKPGGLLVISLNPKWAKSMKDVEEMGREIMDQVSKAGFVQNDMEVRWDLKPFGAVAVTARYQ